MKYVMSVLLALSASTAMASDFFTFQDALFRNNNLCDATMNQDANAYLSMYNTLKHDYNTSKGSKIEVVDDGAYASELLDKNTGKSCLVIQHDGCYSAMCN